MKSLSDKAIELAAILSRAAIAGESRDESRQSKRLARMMNDPRGKAFTLAMVDQVFRSTQPSKQAGRFREILREFGAPKYLSPMDRTLMRLASTGSRWLPGMAMSAVAERIRGDSAKVVLAGEAEALSRYLAERHKAGTRVNLNQLGEAILGEEEATRRIESILAHLANPAINYISVKISAIFSQINLLDWNGTLRAIKDRLRRLYRAAMPEQKFINLDMEEYRDLHLTIDAFRETLAEPEFSQLRAGVVLQAYLPDSWKVQQDLTAWAIERVKRGGSPVKLRLVKGANLAMEAVEAELHGWVPAPYSTKAETDANYKRMLEFGCRPEHASALNLGVASHNLFDVALALVLREENGVADFVDLEMLEGMANHQARVVQQAAGGLVVYAPVVNREDFNSAIAYLVRRLDENTAPGSFLRDIFGLTPGTPAWERQQDRFVEAWESRNSVSDLSRRRQSIALSPDGFTNIPDTDWTQVGNRKALAQALTDWSSPVVPPAGELERVLITAIEAQPAWESLGYAHRGKLLRQSAEVMQRQRFDTIACMVQDSKKAAGEADSEVSEAIDFAHYYSQTPPPPDDVIARALGIVAVTPPWNFPYAIPCSGVLAALMAGNAVILKPAPETVATAWRLVNQLWEGGIPRDVLQFFPCADDDVGRALITDPRTAAVVLTGAIETARMFLNWRPALRLFAETSGKNGLLITAQADRDLAIKDLVKSAFGHAGQKCSAASLAILEAEVYDDPAFRRQLRDAAASLVVGPATDLASIVTPLIRQPSPALHRALTTLDAGEDWLLEPKPLGTDPCLWSPGIKLGVKAGSWFHRTECFGPVLGLIRARDLDEAIAIQNDSQFALTAGLHSLDEREISTWRERIESGNAYINRAITGAIVERQPFGGWKASSIGPGAKAGGPNYVRMFSHFDCSETPSVQIAAISYTKWWREYFSISHDPANLRAESNEFRYRPCRGVILRLQDDASDAIRLATLAAEICGVPLQISFASQESEAQLTQRLPSLAAATQFLRTVRPPSDDLLRAAHEVGIQWINAPLVTNGRLELPRWLREQAVSRTKHRYGQVIETTEDSASLT